MSLILVGFVKVDSSGLATAAPLHLKRVLFMRAGWILGLIHTLAYGSIVNFGNWVPSLLAEARQMDSATKLAWGGALVLFVSGVGRLGGGLVMYRIKPRSMLIGSMLALCVTYAGLSIFHTATPVLILALLATLWASVSFGALFHMASEATTPTTIGTLFGLINMIANSGAVLFTLMFGWFKDLSGSFMGGFVVLGALNLIALFMGQKFLAREPRP